MPTPIKTLTWAPSEEASKRALGFFAAGGALIGIVGFSVSFDSVMLAARPYLGMASWCVPVMIDLAIFVTSGLALFLQLHGLGAKWIRAIPNALALWTLYLNTATQHAWFGRAVHAAGPALWVVTVEIANYAVRKLVGLSDERRIEGLRRSLWLLRPFATWRIFRQMRIHQITTYAAALDRDAARAAVVGRLRVQHGRLWRQKSPLSERIALRLQGRDPGGVAQVLTDHQSTVMLLQAPAGTQQAPLPGAAPEPAPAALPAAPTRARSRAAKRRTRVAHPATADTRTWNELVDLAQTVNALAVTETGSPAGVGRLKREVGVGQPRAQQLRDYLAALPAPTQVALPAQVEHANGTALI